MILFVYPIMGRASIISPDDDQRSLFSERLTDCHSQVSARHEIERGHRVERAVDL